MRELPGGTVTLLFTDVEGSTQLLKRLGDDWAATLARHRALVREAIAAASGREVDTQGDSFFAVFASARDAAGAAISIQRAHRRADWPAGEQVRVRIALHTGEPRVGEEGYLGLDVVRAARVCAVTAGDQVLATAATRELLRHALPEGATLRELGIVSLRDIDDPEAVAEVVVDGQAGPWPRDAATAGGGEPRDLEGWEVRFERAIEELTAARAEDVGERLLRGLAALDTGGRIAEDAGGKLSWQPSRGARKVAYATVAAVALVLVGLIALVVFVVWLVGLVL